MVIYGRNLYGKVEPLYDPDGQEVLYIVTSFYHIYWFPLIPIKSLLVVAGSETSDGMRGWEIGLNGRSILAAYARAIAFLFVLLAGYLAFRGPL